MNSPPLEVKLSGPMACFTRPENKVERVSYPVPTPSAARGSLEAIFWKPEFSWRIREIVVLKPIAFRSILRNEVDGKASERGGRIVVDERRQQRNTLLLTNVAYVVRADIVLNGRATDDVAKYRDQFRRRVERGQCFQQPFFGCREFVADFAPPDGSEKAIPDSMDMGLMLFDLAFSKIATLPRFFAATLENGILRVPDSEYARLEELS